MASREQTRMPSAIQNGNGGACALAGCVRIASAANVVLAAGVFALSACWGYALPAAGCAVAFLVSAFLVYALKGGAE